MSNSVGGLVTLAREVKDTAGAALSVLWTRSAAGQELARLRGDGHLPGQACDVAFAFSFGEGEADAARRSLADAGFSIADATAVSRGFLTVTAPILLGTYALARTAARARRIGQRHGGHAEVIGLVGERPRRIELTGPGRQPSRTHSVA